MAASPVETMYVWDLVWSDGCEASCVFVCVHVFGPVTPTLNPTVTLLSNPSHYSIHAAVESGTP